MNVETLRYTERRGLLAEPVRRLGGERIYSPEAVTVLRDVAAIRDRLSAKLDAGCDDLLVCATAECCPPFEAITAHSVRALPVVEVSR